MYFILFLQLFCLSSIVLGSTIPNEPEDGVRLREYKIVETTSGLVRGRKFTTLFANKEFYLFRGIPYAEPPIGELRFKAPIEIRQKWGTTVRDAFDFGSVCVQTNSPSETRGSEDCLFLNIYVPATKSENATFPVMIFIHGGGFYEGSGDDNFFDPDFLINKDVILVTINYRLGPFGFLTLGTDEYSGNMGLKDQNMAMKWVKLNTRAFNGDAERITIFGHSAGAGSVHYHAISPLSKGLFKRTIAMSGTALNIWANSLRSQTIHKEIIRNIAEEQQHPADTLDDLIDFLKKVKDETLIKVTTHTNPSNFIKQFHPKWLPVIEDESVPGAFLTERPEIILNRKAQSDIDFMFGNTNAEFLFVVAHDTRSSYLQEFYDTFKVQLPSKRDATDSDYDSADYKLMAEEVKKFYFNEEFAVNKVNFDKYNALLSDIFFNYGNAKSMRLQQKYSTGNTYYYQFTADLRLNMMKKLFNGSMLSGASHGDELCYVFRCRVSRNTYKELETDSPERKLIDHITTLWTNWAKYGNPTLNDSPAAWEPITPDAVNYLEIGNEGVTPSVNPNARAIQFWDDLYTKYRHNNYDNDPIATQWNFEN